MDVSTPAYLHKCFRSRQSLRRDRRFPFLMRNISPETIFCFLAYFNNSRHSLSGSRMVRTSPLRAISVFCRFDRKIFHLTHADTDSADRFHEQCQPLSAAPVCCFLQAAILRAGQFACSIPKQTPLDLKELYPAVLPAKELKQTVYRRYHDADDHRGVTLLQQLLFPPRGEFSCRRPARQPSGKYPDVPQVLVYRAGAPLV